MQATPDDYELSSNIIMRDPMGLITHNRIYVCIGASPCPVIVDLVIIGSVGSCACERLSALRADRSRSCPQAPPLWVAANASGTGLPCGLALAIVGRLRHGLAVGGRPYMGAGCGWPPLLATFIMKTQ
ncbi:hypothetical protein B296_00022778 [Ensete ventricosum]|uniref:Uncharacterized protein n=1 Tax=Ensete ventricosum TaxID=4639 RepID=A0A426XY09_ENSVE|nr:hypothetical protein B296_00022778 [Ensete ventricosum]